MTRIKYKMKVRRKNMRCIQCDTAKALVGAFQNVIEDNKRMKDALISFQALLGGNDTLSFLLDCHDEEANTMINAVYNRIKKTKGEMQ